LQNHSPLQNIFMVTRSVGHMIPSEDERTIHMFCAGDSAELY